MSLDYPPLNPQPVSFSGGSVHVTNLDTSEGYLASIDTSTSATNTIIEESKKTTPSGTAVNVSNNGQRDQLTEIITQLKLIVTHLSLGSGHDLKPTDTK